MMYHLYSVKHPTAFSRLERWNFIRLFSRSRPLYSIGIHRIEDCDVFSGVIVLFRTKRRPIIARYIRWVIFQCYEIYDVAECRSSDFKFTKVPVLMRVHGSWSAKITLITLFFFNVAIVYQSYCIVDVYDCTILLLAIYVGNITCRWYYMTIIFVRACSIAIYMFSANRILTI